MGQVPTMLMPVGAHGHRDMLPLCTTKQKTVAWNVKRYLFQPLKSKCHFTAEILLQLFAHLHEHHLVCDARRLRGMVWGFKTHLPLAHHRCRLFILCLERANSQVTGGSRVGRVVSSTSGVWATAPGVSQFTEL